MESKAVYAADIVPGDEGLQFVAGGLRWDVASGLVYCAECGRLVGGLVRKGEVYWLVIGGWPIKAAYCACPKCGGSKAFNARDVRAARLGMVERVKTPA